MLVGIVFLAAFVWLARERALRGQNDFAAFYAGGRLAGTPDLYSRPANTALVAKVTGVTMPAVVFIRPPFYAALLSPLSALPYRLAYAVFSLIGLASAVWFVVRFSGECPSLPFFAAMSIPVVDALCDGQDTPLLLLFLGTAMLLARRKRDFLAGVVLSLCAIKFHLFVMLPVALLLQRRWRMLAGGGIGIALLTALGAIVSGPGALLDWIRLLRDPSIGFAAAVMPNLHGLVAAVHADPRLEIVLAAAVLGAFLWTVSRAESFDVLLAVSIVCGLLVNFHSGISDDVLLLVVFVAVTANYASAQDAAASTMNAGNRTPAGFVVRGFTGGAPMRSLIALLLTPIPWFMVLAGSPYNAVVPAALLLLMGFFCVLRPSAAPAYALRSENAH